jgi:hypothetical protein
MASRVSSSNLELAMSADPPYPQKQIDEITLALGTAIAQWQEVEANLFF